MTLPDGLDKDFGHFIRKGSSTVRTKGTCLHQGRQFRISYYSFLEYSAPMEDLAMNNPELLKRITVNPGIFGGKPIIRGMRISVELILSLLAQGETEDAILADYPDLAREDLRACLAYAHAVIAQDSLDAVQVQ